jgi:hypothetical protein
MTKQVEFIRFDSHRNFGVELEVGNEVCPDSIAYSIIKSSHCKDVKIFDWNQSINNSDWHVKSDMSCGIGDEGGWEIASYVGSGYLDALDISKTASVIKLDGAKINRNCGLHVHVNVEDFSVKKMAILLAYWMKIENTLSFAVPFWRVDGAFCQLINKLQAHYKRNKYSPNYFWTINRPRNLSAHDNFYKMFTLNLVNYESSLQGLIDRKTVEFRMPEGTLNESDIINWIRLFVTFVDNCKKKSDMPSNTISVSLSETLNILGLSHNKKFYILSKGMFKTKSWLLKRIMQQAVKRKSDRLYRSSFKFLDFMEH